MSESKPKLRVVEDSVVPGEYLVRNLEFGNINSVLYFGLKNDFSRCDCNAEGVCEHIEAVAEYREENPPKSDLDDFLDCPDSDVEVSIKDGFPSQPPV
jgi:hypothetical protein